MDFELPETHKLIRDTAHRIAKERVAPAHRGCPRPGRARRGRTRRIYGRANLPLKNPRAIFLFENSPSSDILAVMRDTHAVPCANVVGDTVSPTTDCVVWR